MILDISDAEFKDVLNDKQLFLPIRWDGFSFPDTLEKLFNHYIIRLETLSNYDKPSCLSIHADMDQIKWITRLILKTITHYLNGFPAKSFAVFKTEQCRYCRKHP